jgi:hypothetical protein
MFLALLIPAPAIPARTGETARANSAGGSPDKSKARSPNWNPPNVDAPIPGISTATPCPLDDVLQQAGKRTRELATDLQQFNASEQMHAEMLGPMDNVTAVEDRQFDYLVFIREGTNGLLSIRENHTPTRGVDSFDRSMTDSGLAVLALIFYPPYASGYDMRCEGQVEYQGHAAWVVHFQQRKDKPAITRSFANDTGHYPAKLKGRAWIAVDGGQVIHLETNLAEWVPGIHLKDEAISVDYGPVQFHSHPVTLWLPLSAKVFSTFKEGSAMSTILAVTESSGDHRYFAEYSFSDFKLFYSGPPTN